MLRFSSKKLRVLLLIFLVLGVALSVKKLMSKEIISENDPRYYFNQKYYLTQYPEVKDSNIDPFV